MSSSEQCFNCDAPISYRGPNGKHNGEPLFKGPCCSDCNILVIAHRQIETIRILKEENEKLKDFSNWEDHPALKYKVVVDELYWSELNDENERLTGEKEFREKETNYEKSIMKKASP